MNKQLEKIHDDLLDALGELSEDVDVCWAIEDSFLALEEWGYQRFIDGIHLAISGAFQLKIMKKNGSDIVRLAPQCTGETEIEKHD